MTSTAVLHTPFTALWHTWITKIGGPCPRGWASAKRRGVLMQSAPLMQRRRMRSSVLYATFGLLLFSLLMALWACLWVPSLPVF
jgi:hypothetical protein